MSSAAAAAAGMATPSPGSTPGSGVGRRRTTTPTYRSEDQALDQIAKEVFMVFYYHVLRIYIY